MLDLLNALFGVSPAFAQDVGGLGSLASMAPLVLIFGVFYFILIRPQQRKQKEHQAMLGSLAKGEKVVTGGGIIGTVVKIDPGKEEMFVEIAPNVRVAVMRSTISSVVREQAAAPAAAPASAKVETPKPANDPPPADQPKRG
jgi:preprotein translocase subunit YajC